MAVMVALGAGLGPGSVEAQSAIAPAKVTAGTLSFDGHATVGDFVGTTSTVTGEMSGGASLASINGWVEAPVNTIKTGKDKRDRDMNKSMESDQYPMIRFELDSLTPGAMTGDSTGVTLHGKFVIHGVTRPADLAGKVMLTRLEAHVWAGAPMNLKDYKIGGLSKALGILKMHENIEVHIDVTFGLAER
jgi:polyisoprenoid-binding protein YceI